MTLLHSEIPGLGKLGSGKVRDIYDLGDCILLVASDRISAYDSVMPNGIPDKGRVLTQISRYWFRRLRPLVCNHVVTCDDAYVRGALEEAGARLPDEAARKLSGRCTLAIRAQPLPVECVARGYLSGSLWAEYRAAGGPERGAVLHGHELAAGLRESDRLPSPIFTPATKAESGHDENIGMSEVESVLGAEMAERVSSVTLELYSRAAALAAERGIIIADTKFEFGIHRGVLTLIDEALTPDSSRFWESETYRPGGPQASFDKQYVRDWLTQSGWNREPPAPTLPPDVVERTAEKYREVYRRLTGQDLLSAG